ncbi:hypothetical protein G6L37_00020 [Agrobacterium rubi]|nr:hypothetical protein [Agrobacterium rubi]NTF23635.1 hypothetical protein [Agrobacterium rubi]
MSVGHWRNSYRPVKFFFLDWPIGVIVVMSVLHIRPWTLAIDAVAICLGLYMRHIGLGLPAAIRATRAWFAGSYRPALPYWKVRRLVDFEHRRLAWQPTKEKGAVELNPVKADD